MSNTAGVDWWNQKSRYHTRRLATVSSEIENFVLPRFLAHTKPGAVTLADFACGGGGPALEMIEQLQRHDYTITRLLLIDVAPDNIAAASKRIWECYPELEVQDYRVSGSNFDDYSGKPVDFLYCWDAMVHFDIYDIAGYLKSLNRVVQGPALFHHSNHYSVTRDIRNSPRWRNFMSAEIFQQLCISAGYDVLDQHIMPWGDYPTLDCITVVKV